jgi:hypothetical protein
MRVESESVIEVLVPASRHHRVVSIVCNQSHGRCYGRYANQAEEREKEN